MKTFMERRNAKRWEHITMSGIVIAIFLCPFIPIFFFAKSLMANAMHTLIFKTTVAFVMVGLAAFAGTLGVCLYSIRQERVR